MTLFAACLLTVLIECSFLALFGYRDRYSLTVTASANVLTNLTMNLVFRLFVRRTVPLLLLAEVCVTAAEAGIYAAAFGASKKLALLTVSANVLSFALGTPLMMLAARLFA